MRQNLSSRLALRFKYGNATSAMGFPLAPAVYHQGSFVQRTVMPRGARHSESLPALKRTSVNDPLTRFATAKTTTDIAP